MSPLQHERQSRAPICYPAVGFSIEANFHKVFFGSSHPNEVSVTTAVTTGERLLVEGVSISTTGNLAQTGSWKVWRGFRVSLPSRQIGITKTQF